MIERQEGLGGDADDSLVTLRSPDVLSTGHSLSLAGCEVLSEAMPTTAQDQTVPRMPERGSAGVTHSPT